MSSLLIFLECGKGVNLGSAQITRHPATLLLVFTFMFTIHLTLCAEPDFMKFFSKMLSRAGSSSSPTSSINKGRPRDRQSSI